MPEKTSGKIVGFIGLGTMGLPMAINLLRAGYEVRGLSRSKERERTFAQAGGVVCGSCEEIVDNAHVVITMVPDAQALLSVIDEVEGCLQAGTIFIDMSTVGAVAAREVGTRLSLVGVDFLDAPVSGGVTGAENASLSIMVGGQTEVCRRAQPIFAALGKNIQHLGPQGAGQIVKSANQMLVAASIAALGEAVVFLESNGIDTVSALRALEGGLADSAILRAKSEKMINREFSPSFSLRLHAKDMRLACETAQASRTLVPVAFFLKELFTMAEIHHWGELDHSALIRAVELINGK